MEPPPITRQKTFQTNTTLENDLSKLEISKPVYNILYNLVGNKKELDEVEKILFTDMKFTKDFIQIGCNNDETKLCNDFLTEIYDDIEEDKKEWLDNNKEPCFIRVIACHQNTKKTFIEFIVKPKRKEDNKVGVKYYVRRMKELTDDDMDFDELIESDDEDIIPKVFPPVRESKEGLIKVDQKTFNNILVYLVYHRAIDEYSVIVEPS
jgi:hypothetical protein